MTTLRVVNADVLGTQCDVLILKYADGFHGADRTVASALGIEERSDGALARGRFLRLPTHGTLPCRRVLFVGVGALWDFGYAEIRDFARTGLTILADQDCEKDVVALTLHGVGFGLDEREAFTAEVAGLLEYLRSPSSGWRPREIWIVERDVHRANRLQELLQNIEDDAGGPNAAEQPLSALRPLPDAGLSSGTKRHVFVAMPYDESMQDVYEFGICEPVNGVGCLCERCDRSAFTGDVLDRIRQRIASASVVIADLTGANANVYLEVGYAWGRGVPTLLIARKGQELLFDVQTHRCVFYSSISDLRRQLTELMPQLIAATPPALLT